ncbi:MAG: methylated-DNA--[protein]-cysteine S-methyltransferase, partial [Prevotella sp.]
MPTTHAFFLKLPSPLGTLHLESDGEALTCVLYEGEKATHPKGVTLQEAPQLPVFVAARAWLSRYFEGHNPGMPPPVRPQGTPFQQSVWRRLLTIPYGSTTTYGALAAHLAAHNASGRMSAQAVGQAVGRNPISIIIPCHRVIGADGTLTGYAGGLDKKMFLLGLEGSLN